MTSKTSKTTTENWTWADAILANSDLADFEADDCEFDETTGNYKYFGDNGTMVVIDQSANVVGWMVDDYTEVYG